MPRYIHRDAILDFLQIGQVVAALMYFVDLSAYAGKGGRDIGEVFISERDVSAHTLL